MIDRLKGAAQQFVLTAMAGVDYYALYECKVVAQHADLTVDLVPIVQGRIAGHSNVPIRHSKPGVKITVQAGATVLLGWMNGDPSKKYAALWPTGASGDLQSEVVTAAQKLVLSAPQVALGADVGSTGLLTVARNTDPVAAAPTMAAWIAAVTAAVNGIAPGSAVLPSDFGKIVATSATTKST